MSESQATSSYKTGMPDDDIHRFVAAGPNDLRGPCPAMNTLANHGYLPRDGRNLTFSTLVNAQVEVYNMSYPLASLLALTGLITCGNGFTVDLKKLRKHNAIEHDASLGRDDIRTGDNFTIDPTLVKELIGDSSSAKGLSRDDIARARVRREKTLPSGKLDLIHSKVALGEATLAIGVWGIGDENPSKHVVPLSRLESFFLHERLPEDWTPPAHQFTFTEAFKMGLEIKNKMAEILDEEKKE